MSKFRQRNALNAGAAQAERSEDVRRRQDEARRRGAETQKRRSHEALLKAGASLFAERGWNTNLDEVAVAAGVSNGRAYTHFGSKGLLIAHVYAPLVATLDTHARAALEREAPRRVLGVHVGDLATLICTNRLLTRAVVTAIHEEDAQGEVAEGKTNIRELVPFDQPLRRIIGTGQERGDFLTQHPADALAKYHAEAMLQTVFRLPKVSANDLAHLALSQMSF